MGPKNGVDKRGEKIIERVETMYATVEQLSNNYRTTIEQLSNNYQKLSNNYRTTIEQLSNVSTHVRDLIRINSDAHEIFEKISSFLNVKFRCRQRIMPFLVPVLVPAGG